MLPLFRTWSRLSIQWHIFPFLFDVPIIIEYAQMNMLLNKFPVFYRIRHSKISYHSQIKQCKPYLNKTIVSYYGIKFKLVFKFIFNAYQYVVGSIIGNTIYIIY